MYVIAPGRKLRHNGSIYPAGADAPRKLSEESLAALLADGCLCSPPAAPASKPQPRPARRVAFSHDAWDAGSPETSAKVPIKMLPALLVEISDLDVLGVMMDADKRVTAKRHYEDRIEDLD